MKLNLTLHCPDMGIDELGYQLIDESSGDSVSMREIGQSCRYEVRVPPESKFTRDSWESAMGAAVRELIHKAIHKAAT